MKYRRKPKGSTRVKVPRGKVYIIEERCKGCGFCIEFCPWGVLAASHDLNARGYHPPYAAKEEACTNCGLCEMICPEFAIYSLLGEGLEPDE